MGSGNSAANEEKEREIKLVKLVEFIRGIIADELITDSEFAALDKYRQTEHIDNEMYEKALSTLGLTLKDVMDLRDKNDEDTKKAMSKLVKIDNTSRTVSTTNTCIDNRSIHVHHHHHHGMRENKTANMIDTKKKQKPKKERAIKYKQDGTIDKRCKAFKVMDEYGIKCDDLRDTNKNNEKNKNRKRARESIKDDDDEEPAQKKRKISPSKTIVSPQKINKMIVAELKEKCKEFGLNVSGNKKALQDRLKQYVKDEKNKNKK